ncbi:MAG: histidine kinase [Bacteroidota bacterium]
MYPNETRIYHAILTGVGVLLIFMAISIITIIRYHRKKTAFERKRMKADINGLEKERKRIATDLHDDFGASLSAIKLRLQCLEPDNESNIVLAQQCQIYIDEAMNKLRHISFNIMPQILHRNGLTAALNELIDMLIPATGVKVNYSFEAEPNDIEKRVHIYRIVQEIMNNIIRHSKATIVILTIKRMKEKILLHIHDNGIGFDKKFLSKIKGEGLRNITARVELLNAKMYLETEMDKGVDYLIEIPEQ